MPTTIHVAFTSPVNPPNTTPLITRPQLWAGLERKVRHAQDFVPVFTDCQVLKEESIDGNKVLTRRAIIKDGAMEHVKERYIQEVCTLYAPTKVDFLSEKCVSLRFPLQYDSVMYATRLTPHPRQPTRPKRHLRLRIPHRRRPATNLHLRLEIPGRRSRQRRGGTESGGAAEGGEARDRDDVEEYPGDD